MAAEEFDDILLFFDLSALGDLLTMIDAELGKLLGGHPKPATDGHLKTGHQ